MIIFARCPFKGPKIAILRVNKEYFLLFLVSLLLLLSGGASFPAAAQYDKDHFYFAGRRAIMDGKYQEAIENFNILARLDTTDHWTFFYRGIAKYNLGDLRGAQGDFDRAVRINPVFTAGYHYRAITEGRFGHYDEALADLETALNLRPGNYGIYFTRGVTYFLSQQFAPAVADFDKYIRKEPKDPSAYLNRGACYLFLQDTVKALHDYNKAIRLDRFEPEGYSRRGRLYAVRGETEAALKDFDRAIELDPENSLSYFYRAQIHYGRSEWSAAVADFDRVLELEPGNALTLYNRSLIYAQVGEMEKALADMDRVLDINPENVLAHFNRAVYFTSMEQWENALEDYDAAIALFPDFAKAYQNRAYVNQQLGRSAASRRDLQTARSKVEAYRAGEGGSALADTTAALDRLIALDADFAKKDFENEQMNQQEVGITLRGLYTFRLASAPGGGRVALSQRYENPLLDRFIAGLGTPVTLNAEASETEVPAPDIAPELPAAQKAFLRGLQHLEEQQYLAASSDFEEAIEAAGDNASGDRYAHLYQAFYRLSRGVLRAEMIRFIAGLESSVQTLSLDGEGRTRARVRDSVVETYDYSEAIDDIREALALLPDLPYLHYDLGILECLSGQSVEAVSAFTQAIERYPAMGDAYFNRGLVLLYLKDKEKGCIDLSRAGELGVPGSYRVIAKYCEKESMQQ